MDGTEKVSRLYKVQSGRDDISCRQRRGGLANPVDPHTACSARAPTLAPRKACGFFPATTVVGGGRPGSLLSSYLPSPIAPTTRTAYSGTLLPCTGHIKTEAKGTKPKRKTEKEQGERMREGKERGQGTHKRGRAGSSEQTRSTSGSGEGKEEDE